ncbi:MAG TPA: hypothetical protein VK932_02220 [Kofleriaceae bacterium]|nr:hypothetical protein [Kofleriaceae bacterium]
MTDRPDDPRRRSQEPAAAEPAAEPAAESYPPPMFAPAAEGEPAAAIPEPTAATEAAPADPAPADEPLLPATYSENDLRTAIGSPPMPEQIRPRRARDEDDDGDPPRRRKAVLVVAGTLFVGAGLATLVVLGKLNAGRYAVSCEARQVIAEQGRSFPPWGMSRLGGDAWKPIPIPPSFQCVGRSTDDPAELGDAYRKMLVERAEALLTAKEPKQLEEAAGMLEQALLHARGDSPPHRAGREAIQRMLGDVGYGRASAALEEALTELAGAAKQFEAAAGQRPRFASDADAWAAHVRKLIDALRAGPDGAEAQAASPVPAPAPARSPDRPPAPPGVALPVEPAATGSAGSAEPPPPAPDAGVPSGGVLL